MKKAIIFGLILTLFISGVGAVPLIKPKLKPNFPFTFSITPSKKVVKPDSQVTFNVSLSASPTKNLPTNKYKRRWASWFVVDSGNNVVKKGNWKQVENSYEKQVPVTISSPGNYAFVALIRENYYVYSSEWKLDSKKTIAKESQKFTVKPEAPQPSPPIMSQILTNIVNWLKGLF